jgi:hypothetical protein
MAYVIGVLITALVTLVIAACKVAGEADEIERGMHDEQNQSNNQTPR